MPHHGRAHQPVFVPQLTLALWGVSAITSGWILRYVSKAGMFTKIVVKEANLEMRRIAYR